MNEYEYEVLLYSVPLLFEGGKLSYGPHKPYITPNSVVVVYILISWGKNNVGQILLNGLSLNGN